ncbi:DUF6428 family protein [Nonlabens ponticola]|uniref:Uncharacterized protein n=1 Tax=Nonlabens ponticola TaxID=2496866 RepID=A0A3S9MVF4_9FLAO|nr:DUF6428 family protein [Nonlabens ponticola]AZQ43160.1 hypothetical protein EJ995_02515 [Nonlabens ponticola]
MKLSELLFDLKSRKTISFQLENGQMVPTHFHVTEVGKNHRHFIDCGGKEREETTIKLQLWEADDYDHRLHPEKLVSIIELSIQKLRLPDVPVEVEYQVETIGIYNLESTADGYILTNKKTACLAMDACGIPQEKPRVRLSQIQSNSCAPGSGCC